MATFTKALLSGSTGGRGIKVVATATAGTTIHTTGTSASALDEVWLYATNQSAGVVTLTVEWGGVTSPDDLLTIDIPAKSGLTIVVEGLLLSGDGSAGKIVRAFAGTTNVIMVHGFVNRIA